MEQAIGPAPVTTMYPATVVPATPQSSIESVNRISAAIKDAFSAYHAEFKYITRKAKQRFEQCDWHALHSDAVARLDLYKDFVASPVKALKAELGERANDRVFWMSVKHRYTQTIADLPDFDLAESFYNSVVMRVAASSGLDPDIQYVGREFNSPLPVLEAPAYRVYRRNDTTQGLIQDILLDCHFFTHFRDLEQDSALAGDMIASYLKDVAPVQRIEMVEIARPVFYRGKSAYLVGRIHTTNFKIPLVLSLSNGEQGIYVDAVLLTEDEVSIIFSFAREYFHVEVEKPYALVQFLKSIMPLKPIAELYISLGYNKHGKTELYRDLMRHLARSRDKFEIARGDRGMVMMVFTLPSYDVVFKIIKDRFDYPKTTTRQEVRNHYHLVFKHDRGGRLVDAQEFEHLRFAKDRFSPALLDELLSVAANSVSVQGDEVVIKHLYTERRLTPLNLYVREMDPRAATEAVIDYGQAIKDLAYTNIFPGDILLKNFGVTRHGRVVFYDYDELCLLNECSFRKMPEPDDSDDDLLAEPWYSVGEQDVFPEELKTFLGLPPRLADVFMQYHGDLFGVDFWADLQARHEAGEVIAVLPYKESRRLPHAG